MKNNEKIEKIQAVLKCSTSRIENYYDLLKSMGDMVYNHTDYVEQSVDKEINKLPYADYHMCCCLLTLVLREDYFINGKFEERFAEDKVISILERMIETLR